MQETNRLTWDNAIGCLHLLGLQTCCLPSSAEASPEGMVFLLLSCVVMQPLITSRLCGCDPHLVHKQRGLLSPATCSSACRPSHHPADQNGQLLHKPHVSTAAFGVTLYGLQGTVNTPSPCKTLYLGTNAPQYYYLGPSVYI